MTPTTIVFLNVALSTLAALGVFGLLALARRLPDTAPHADESWGRGGDPWIPSDPLPLVQLVAHERELGRAA